MVAVDTMDIPRVMKIMLMPLLLDRTPICMAVILQGMLTTNLLSSNSN